jgi:hypothetical protein
VPLWLVLILVGFAAVVIHAVFAATRSPRPTLDLSDREALALRRVWRLRFLAVLAVLLGWAQREFYEGGPRWVGGTVCGLFLVLALVLVVASWWLARGMMR